MIGTAASYLWAAAQAHPYVAGTMAIFGLWWVWSWWNSSAILPAPKRGQYCLRDLKVRHLWRLHINPKDFDKAEQAAAEHKGAVITDPGDYYGAYNESDQVKPELQRTNWFKKSMQAALGLELNFGNDNGRLGTRVDYREYVRLHDLVTSKFEEGEKVGTLTSMRAHSSYETSTEFPIDDWGGKSSDIADDLALETIGGRSLCHRWNGRGKLDVPSTQHLTIFDAKTRTIAVLYDRKGGEAAAQQIFDRYYLEVAAAKSQDARLLAIVRAIRAIHVVHPFRDANGRLNVQLLLNKFLLEQGFSITVLDPRFGLGVFGGAISAADLVTLVKAGLLRFQSYC